MGKRENVEVWKCENGGMGERENGNSDQHLQSVGCGLNCAKRRWGEWEGRKADSAGNGGGDNKRTTTRECLDCPLRAVCCCLDRKR